MKKVIAVILCLVIIFTATITAYAGSIQPFSNNVNSTDVSFSISSSGKATVSYEYYGKSGVTKSAKIVTKVQKKVGIIWVTVNGGSWTDTSTSTNFSRSHSVQLMHNLMIKLILLNWVNQRRLLNMNMILFGKTNSYHITVLK